MKANGGQKELFSPRLLAAAVAHLVIIGLVLASTSAAQAPDYPEPTREAFGLGLVLAFEDRLVTTAQPYETVVEICGVERQFGCVTWIGGGDICQLHVRLDLYGDWELQVRKHLIAECGATDPYRLARVP